MHPPICFYWIFLTTLISPIAAIISSSTGIDGVSRDPDDVKFYYSKSPNESVEIMWNDEQSLIAAGFRSGQPIILLIDGCDSPQTPYYDVLTEAIRNKTSTNGEDSQANIISVDYSKLNGRDSTGSTPALAVYIIVVQNTDIVGERIADMLHLLHEQGHVETKDIHLISFSVGAHVAGSAGALFKSKYGKTIRRITGLSPARTFYPFVNVHRLRSGDADFVDNYFTNKGTIGEIYENTGDATIYINGGSIQPGCEIEDWTRQPYPGLCSHLYAWEFFSATFTKEYTACPCSEMACHCRKNCNSNCDNPVKVGMDISPSVKGTHSLLVNDPHPGVYYRTFKHKILPQYQHYG